MKLALIGYGKMGKEIEKIAVARGHQMVCIIDVNNPEAFDSEAFRMADAAIEFTGPLTAYANYMKAFEAGVKVVSGSTGWMDRYGDEVKQCCLTGGKTLFWASNFSIGVAVFAAVNTYLAKLMNPFPQYDVTLSETHHVHKLDAPSGTAVTLAEGILANLDRKERWTKETAQSETDLPVHSIREGEVFGIHTIRYDSAADSITLTHDAKNRGGFALGAVLAAEFTAQNQGWLGMSDMYRFMSL